MFAFEVLPKLREKIRKRRAGVTHIALLPGENIAA
jgi:hypothetical protein